MNDEGGKEHIGNQFKQNSASQSIHNGNVRDEI
jgi:hypothetical protein